jgi:eukaryotic-like serine/threonine-protein kinase
MEYIRLKPDNVIDYGNLMSTYLALNRIDDARSAFEQARARNLDDPYLRLMRYYLAFLERDSNTMQEQLNWVMGKPGGEDLLLSAQSDTEAYYGRIEKAREFSKRAVESALQANTKETAALWQGNEAIREAEFGNGSRARQASTNALALAGGRDVEVLAALTLALVGDRAAARKLLTKLDQESPLNTMIRSYWLPTIRAVLELDDGNAPRAIELLEAAKTYELVSPLQFQVGTMYPAYVRGQAYLRAGQAQQAAELQKVIDHRGEVVNCFTGALSHLRLGRVYAIGGDTVKAKAAYQDFLTLWKDADPDIPILKEAKAEYAKLQ